MLLFHQSDDVPNATVREFCAQGRAGELQGRRPGRVFTLVSRQKDTAMSTDYLPKITPRDLSVLEAMLDRDLLGDEALTGAVRRKLQLAQIVFADDLEPNIVTLGSRVAFQADDEPVEERTLVTIEHYAEGEAHQTIASQRGIAMLGLAEGNCIEVECEDGSTEALAIIQVLYQPEADRKARGARPGLRLVSSREEAGKPVPAPNHPYDDDPGPSAA